MEKYCRGGAVSAAHAELAIPMFQTRRKTIRAESQIVEILQKSGLNGRNSFSRCRQLRSSHGRTAKTKGPGSSSLSCTS
jgi:hypothetical protein